MQLSKAIAAIVVFSCLAFSPGVVQAGRLFFSTSATSPIDVFASETNPKISVALGQEVAVYVWYERHNLHPRQYADYADTLYGLSLDILSSNPIVSRAGFTIDNPEIAGYQRRWAAIGYGAAPDGSLLVDDSNAVRTFGNFIGEPLDPLFDPVTSAIPKPSQFNAGVVRYATLTLRGQSLGSTAIRFGVGDDGIAYKWNPRNSNHLTKFGWGDSAISGYDKGMASLLADMTVNVVGIVPEPSSLVLFALGAVGVVAARRQGHRRAGANLSWRAKP